MLRQTPPCLATDFQPLIVLAHRRRSAVVASLFRDVARWVSFAAA